MDFDEQSGESDQDERRESDKESSESLPEYSLYLVDGSAIISSAVKFDFPFDNAAACSVANNLKEIRSNFKTEKENVHDLDAVLLFDVVKRDSVEWINARLLKDGDIEDIFMKERSKYGILSKSRENSLYSALRAAEAILHKGSGKKDVKSIIHFTREDWVDPFEGIQEDDQTDMRGATQQLARSMTEDPGISLENFPLRWLDEKYNVLIFYADLIGLENEGRAQLMPTSGEKYAPDQIPSPNCNPAGLETQSMCSSKEGLICGKHAPRYLNDFEEVDRLGKGGFGSVFLCKHKLDGIQYAVKKIPLPKGLSANDRMLREVLALSRLQHEHVVRYYQAFTGSEEESGKAHSGSDSYTNTSLSNQGTNINSREYLYIQMEYCPRTLSKVLLTSDVDEELVWNRFHQLAKGLEYIHGQGIMHRDLNPLNIFLDSNDHIKIGDFGLAKFLEQLDHDDGLGTGKVGNKVYMAPEIANEEPYNEKVDMYNLGIIFFEMCQGFSTDSERYPALAALKEGKTKWAEGVKSQMVKALMDTCPSKRPSAKDLIEWIKREGH